MNDPRSDAAISRDVARVAGQLLLRIRQDFIAEHGPIGEKETANMLRDRADAASNDLILDFCFWISITRFLIGAFLSGPL